MLPLRSDSLETYKTRDRQKINEIHKQFCHILKQNVIDWEEIEDKHSTYLFDNNSFKGGRIDDTFPEWQMKQISSGADAGPRSRVCAHLTLRLNPSGTGGNSLYTNYN